MIISRFTTPELDYFREHCGFTKIETQVFELRSQGASLQDISFVLKITIDSAKKVSQKINKKIIKAL